MQDLKAYKIQNFTCHKKEQKHCKGWNAVCDLVWRWWINQPPTKLKGLIPTKMPAAAFVGQLVPHCGHSMFTWLRELRRLQLQFAATPIGGAPAYTARWAWDIVVTGSLDSSRLSKVTFNILIKYVYMFWLCSQICIYYYWPLFTINLYSHTYSLIWFVYSLPIYIYIILD